jgi:CRP-like cAMP-binding protein
LGDRFETQGSIVQRIIDGSVTIDSIGEFENVTKIFPDDPGIYRAFADLLAQKKSIGAAVNAYRKATRLFIDLGMTLQAIVSKILEWRIVQPSHQEGRAFYSDLRKAEVQEGSLENFLTRMAYPEIVAFMVNLVRVRLPARKIVKKFGDPENDIYFVVSGSLKETTFRALAEGEWGAEKSTADLAENDFFGDVYPFDQQEVSQSDVETITRVELVKISKERLRTVCNKYPNVELLVRNLYGTRSESREKEPTRTVRKTARHKLPTKVRLKIFPQEPDKSPLVVDGITEDISSGGACLVLGAKYRTGHPAGLLGKSVKVEMNLPRAVANLNILGTVVWSKEVPQEGETSIVVGVQFKEMSDDNRAALDDYCFGSEGEQNLIWSLWESYMKH